MARSVYSAYIGQTPRTARAHAPATMRVAEAEASAASSAHAAADPGSHFLGHTAACPFIRGGAGESEWYESLLQYDDDDTYVDALLDSHARVGCVVMTREQLVEQLVSAIGRDRLERVHGDAAPFHGHTLACALVRAPADEAEGVWRDERGRLEAGLGGVGVAGFTLDDVLRRHRDAGCFAADDIDWTSPDAVADVARHLIAQLHLACHDFDDDDDDGGADDVAWLDAPVLSVDDVNDYEAQYRLDTIRDHADEAMDFSLDSISL